MQNPEQFMRNKAKVGRKMHRTRSGCRVVIGGPLGRGELVW